MLHRLSQCRNVAMRLRISLIVGGVALCALPTVHQMAVNAQTTPPPADRPTVEEPPAPEEPTPAEPAGQQPPAVPASPSVEPPPPRTTGPEPAAPAQTIQQTEFLGRSLESGGGLSLDLVNLANSYVEAQGALDAAELKLQQLEPLANQDVVSEQVFSQARLAHKSAARRVKLLRRIIDVSRETTAMELEVRREQLKLVEAAFKPEHIGRDDRIVSLRNRETQARRNLMILESILESK